MKPTAVTVVARNYVPHARTLCESFLTHHPDGRFFVFLIDDLDGAFDPQEEEFELLSFDCLDLPMGDLFFYKYSILELSTAIKPFLFKYIFTEYQVDSLLYLDPDLYITAALTSIYDAFSHSNIVLTPHMFTPPPDDGKSPSENDIMHSGVYNLGFLGMKKHDEVYALLDWWSSRLANKCVVDLANALFVDQRWMDLAPSYFDGVEILRDPTLNVAYWNLHERKMSKVNDLYYVNEKRLSFFHFSGFDPHNFGTLSKHQTRHAPSDNVALSIICKEYAEIMLGHEYDRLTKITVVFNSLSNGVRLGKLTQFVVRNSIDKGLNIPSPVKFPDAFCRFLMTPNYLFDRRGIVPILVALEKLRPDVKAAFPGAFESSSSAKEILKWIDASGGKEEQISELFNEFRYLLNRLEVVHCCLDIWWQREDLRIAFPDAFVSTEGAQKFSEWIETYGTVEESFAVGDGSVFLQRRRGLLGPLMLYFQDSNLQQEFKFIFLQRDRVRYVKWLYNEACPRNIVSAEDVAWFDGFVESCPDIIARVVLGHGSWLHSHLVGGGTLFDLRHIKDLLAEYNVKISGDFYLDIYRHCSGSGIFAQAEQFYLYSPELRDHFPTVFKNGDQREIFVERLLEKVKTGVEGVPGDGTFVSEKISENKRSCWWRILNWFNALLGWTGNKPQEVDQADLSSALDNLRRELLDGFARISSNQHGVNLAGYLLSPTGMGESSRSMYRTLQATEFACSQIPLPTTHLGTHVEVDDLESGTLLSSHDPASKVNIIVANGDDYTYVRSRLPHAFWQKKINIGYWVWETESLPDSHSDSEGLSEVWTPSEYSAAAIRSSIDLPVRVVPHVLDFDEFEDVQADRERFNLPAGKVVYGFFFDCKSVIERKNPFGLLKAFRQAFAYDNDDAILLLKVSSSELEPLLFSKLKSATKGLNVVWITDVLTRADVLCLMKSLDVYVSLHRSEGFGLTLAEAMAMGKPVVASNYSGNVDFMTETDSCLVDTKVIETEEAFGPYPTGTRWGDPDLVQAANYLSSLLEASERNKIGNVAQKAIRERLHPRVVGAKVNQYLNKIEAV